MQISLDLDTSKLGQLDGLGKRVQKNVLKQAAQDMTRFLMQNSPVDHGLLKSWFIASLTDTQAHIKSPAKYAIYQDQGTRPYLIYPKKRNGWLYWEGAPHPVKRVAHPGIMGKHFVMNSFLEVEQRTPGYLARALEGEL